MTREILGALEEGALDALRTYAALIMAPFNLTRSLVARMKGVRAHSSTKKRR